MSFTDDTGQIINLPKVPQRIVSIGPMITEILGALGASKKIVGIDDFSRWPTTEIPIPRLGEPFVQGDVISPKLGIDTNAIVALHPDLVIANVGSWVRASESVPWGSKFPFPGLDKAGIPTVCLTPVVGVNGTLKRLLSLGAIVGEPEKASELVTSYEKRKQAVVDRVQNLPKVRVVLAWGHGGGPPAPGPPVAGDDPLSELIQLAGGVNVFTSSPDDKNMVQKFSENPFTLEPYIAKNPEVILVFGGLDQWQLDRAGWEKVEAVQKGRVHAIGEITPLTVIDRLEEIAKLLYPGIDWSDGNTQKELTHIVASIIANPYSYEGQRVTVVGYFRGWDLLHEANTGPPTTRSDWVIRDASGAIYIGLRPTEGRSGGGSDPRLDPSSREDIDTIVKIVGVIRVTDAGQPYIELQSMEILP